MHELPNFDRVSNEAIDFANSAMRSGWTYSDYLRTAKDAWVIAHEEALKQAKYHVEKGKGQ